MSPPQQSIPLCVFLAISCGVLSVVASLCVAYPTYLIQHSRDVEFSPRFLRIGSALNIFFQLASAAALIISNFYGPISLVDPTVRSSMLLSNMLLYGPTGLNIESFSTEMRIATFQVVLATILLPTVGPGSQDDQHLEEILMRPLSILWLTSLTICMLVFSSRLHTVSYGDFLQWSETSRLALLLGAFVPAASVSASCSKALALANGAIIPLEIATLGVALSLYIEIHVFYRASLAVQQARFVPLLSSCCILTVASSGIVVWEDNKAISSWSGYVSVMALIVLANYQLLCCDGSNKKDLDAIKFPDTIEVNNPSKRARDKGVGSDREILPLLSAVDEFTYYSNMEAAVSSDSETASDTESESSCTMDPTIALSGDTYAYQT